MSFTPADQRFMARALALAARGQNTTHPNPRVGCVIVRGDQVVGEGWHRRAGEPHAEVLALAEAGEAARGATIYLTLEPCSHSGRTPPCVDAVVAAAPARVVVAMLDPNPVVDGNAAGTLRKAGIEVAVGLYGDRAEALNRGFVSRMRRGRPWVISKIAASVDGRTAVASGESKWISSAESRADVQQLRAGCSAIVTGIGTVLADDPSLNVRLENCERQPLRVICDTRLRTAPGAQTLGLDGDVVIATASNDGARRAALAAAGAGFMDVAEQGGHLDLRQLLELLAQREVNEVLVEAGPILNGALVAAGLTDELVIYYAPSLLGGDGRAMFQLPQVVTMADKVECSFSECTRVGPDLKVRLLLADT